MKQDGTIFMLHKEEMNLFKYLSDADCGKVLKAIMHFADTGEVLLLNGIAGAVLNTALPSFEYLLKRSKKNRENAARRRERYAAATKTVPDDSQDGSENGSKSDNESSSENDSESGNEKGGFSKSVNHKSVNHKTVNHKTLSCPSAKNADGREADKQISLKENAVNVLNYLNSKTGTGFKPAKGTLKSIISWLREHPPELCRAVIDSKAEDPYFMENPRFYHPETLFRASNKDVHVAQSAVYRLKREINFLIDRKKKQNINNIMLHIIVIPDTMNYEKLI